jgi:hypothetical protein
MNTPILNETSKYKFSCSEEIDKSFLNKLIIMPYVRIPDYYTDLFVLGTLGIRSVQELKQNPEKKKRLNMVMYILKKNDLPITHHFNLYPPREVYSESISENLQALMLYGFSDINLNFYEKELTEKYGDKKIEKFKKIINKIKDMSKYKLFEECKRLAQKN